MSKNAVAMTAKILVKIIAVFIFMAILMIFRSTQVGRIIKITL
ncbi:hypothetical protein BTN49_0743 [Candidatus Enterovibrio escicola]|uniref:Uncharacterized protein n=1 Tax=Candidatus Enterovibrio escicola TaxID=1927127 RepID=A0A2A5T6J3_9GAMM|nr:hypothetical protein BTN49_0743 [Candidatus Enterovibrio escacola]